MAPTTRAGHRWTIGVAFHFGAIVGGGLGAAATFCAGSLLLSAFGPPSHVPVEELLLLLVAVAIGGAGGGLAGSVLVGTLTALCVGARQALCWAAARARRGSGPATSPTHGRAR
jgi:hypothetical protein